MATALSIGAAACGGGSVSTATAPTTAVPTSAANGSTASNDGGGTDAAENLFPSVDVTRISDGSTLNLQAELQGGDLPVLLWFWAPH